VVTTPGNVTSEQISLIPNATRESTASPDASSGVQTEVWLGVGAAVAAVAGAVAFLYFRRPPKSR
jgi:hypothetical protein